MARIVGLVSLAAMLALPAGPARAEKVENPIAVFAALDKVTGRISHLEIPLNETVQFGALKVTPRVCNTRPPTEPPHTSAFVEVDEIKLNGEVQRIFTGWMFGESPGLHAVEHPVFDVWLTSCKTSPAAAPVESDPNAEAGTPPADGTAPPADGTVPPAVPGAAPAPGTEAAPPVDEEPAPMPTRKPPKPRVPPPAPPKPTPPPAPAPTGPGGFWQRL